MFVVRQDHNQLIKQALRKGEKNEYEKKDSYVFYKAFKGENENYHIAGFSLDENGKLINSTYYEVKSNDIGRLKGMIKVPERDFKYYKGSTTSAKNADNQSSYSPSRSATDETIPKENLKIDKELKDDANSANQRGDKEDLYGSKDKQTDTNELTDSGYAKKSEGSRDARSDTRDNMRETELPTKDKSMEGQNTPKRDDTDIQGANNDKLVQDEGKTLEKEVDDPDVFKREKDDEIKAIIENISTNKNIALKIKPNDDILELMLDFKEPINTPIFKSKISIDILLNHLSQKSDAKHRMKTLSLIKPTLEKPLFIAKDKNRYRFFKTFLDEDKTIKYLVVTEDNNGQILGITSTKLKNTDVKNLLKNNTIIWGGDTLESLSTPQTSHQKTLSAEKKPNPQTLTDAGSLVGKSDNLSPKALGERDKLETLPKNRSGKIAEPTSSASESNFNDSSRTLNSEIIPNKEDKSQDIFKREALQSEHKQTFWEWWNNGADKLMDKTERFFKGLDENGMPLKRLNEDEMEKAGILKKAPQLLRKGFVGGAYVHRDLVQILKEDKDQRAYTQMLAKRLSDDLNKLDDEDSKLLVLALDGDIEKENIKATLKDEGLYKTYQDLRLTIDKNAQKLVELGLLDESSVKEDYVKRFYEDHVKDKGLFDGLFGGGLGHKKVYKRKDLDLLRMIDLRI